MKYGVAPMFAFLGAVVTGHFQGQAKKEEATKLTDTAYKTLAPVANEQAAELKAIRDDLAKLADTVAIQGKLLLANQPGFTPTGAVAPVAPTARRKKPKRAPAAAPALIKQVQDNAAKNLQEIKERALEPTPAVAPVPTQIPKEPPPLPPEAAK
jgi:hypothetical protein